MLSASQSLIEKRTQELTTLVAAGTSSPLKVPLFPRSCTCLHVQRHPYQNFMVNP